MSTLFQAAQIAGAVTAILACVTVVGRFAMSLPRFKKFIGWIREGYHRDRENEITVVMLEHLPAVLDKTLAFNGTGSFRQDMRIFYLSTTEFMRESAEDRASIHREIAEKFPPKEIFDD